MLKNLLNKKKESGFTIIEVMIVLAIAGLILVVVLIAIPQLQRNQRNQARQATLARLTSEIQNYAGNNNGNIPESDSDLDDVYDRYIGCGSSADASDGTTLTSCNINVEDPTTGTGITTTFSSQGTVTGVPTTPSDVGSAIYQEEASCDGETIVDQPGSGRAFAIWTQLEGGAYYCLDTQ